MTGALRILGVGHVVVAMALLPITRTPGFDDTAIFLVVPLWFAALGVWLFRPSETLRRTLRATHIVAAPFAVWICAYGVFALGGDSDGETAGGVPVWLPVVAGVLAGVLSVASLAVIRVWPPESSA